jgi:hypothetical protein
MPPRHSQEAVGAIAGLLKKASIEGGYVTMEAVLPVSQTDYDRQMVERLQRQAVKCWYQAGHPGWSIWPADSEQFVQGVCTQPGTVTPGPVQIVAPVPLTLTSGNPPPRNGAHVGSPSGKSQDQFELVARLAVIRSGKMQS